MKEIEKGYPKIFIRRYPCLKQFARFFCVNSYHDIVLREYRSNDKTRILIYSEVFVYDPTKGQSIYGTYGIQKRKDAFFIIDRKTKKLLHTDIVDYRAWDKHTRPIIKSFKSLFFYIYNCQKKSFFILNGFKNYTLELQNNNEKHALKLLYLKTKLVKLIGR